MHNYLFSLLRILQILDILHNIGEFLLIIDLGRRAAFLVLREGGIIGVVGIH